MRVVTEWVCLIVGTSVVWLPLLIMFVLPRVLRWHDAKRDRVGQERGFEVKTNTGQTPVLQEQEKQNG